jgi:hypothetical protein
MEVPFDILAVQETHLAKVPLGRAYSEAAALGLHLHHGRRVAEWGTPSTGARAAWASSRGGGWRCRLSSQSVQQDGAYTPKAVGMRCGWSLDRTYRAAYFG